MGFRISPSGLRLAGALAAAMLVATTGLANADALRDKWCSKVHLRFFVGGAEGDAFGTIVYNGARQAAADTGAQVDYVFSGWSQEKMIQQLREAVAGPAARAEGATSAPPPTTSAPNRARARRPTSR